MSRSFLTIAAALPLSVTFAPIANAAEVPTPQSEKPALSASFKPVSTITFTQRENTSSSNTVKRPLVIAEPVASNAAPVALPAPITPPVPKPATVVAPTPIKVSLPPVPTAKPATVVPAVSSATTPVLSPQLKSALEIEMNLPVYVVKKPNSKQATPVALAASKPEPKSVVAKPAVTAPVAPAAKVLANVELFPKETPKAVVAKPATPTRLASREARANQLLLARLDADLARAERNLQRSETRLSEGQRQLGSINNVIKSAMIGLGDEGKGLHPFVRVAQRYLGTPYVWGGESARGFDCSGFIMRVMRDLGYKALPHSAAEQFRYGTPVAKPLLKAGDIVFFANTYKRGVSHVGIYLGRGRFIHAANSQDGTIVSDLNSAKWTAHYAGARRLVSQ